MLTLTETLLKIKRSLGFKTDFQLAKDMGVSEAALAQWRRRGTLKRDLLEYCVAKGLSLNELLLTEEEKNNMSSTDRVINGKHPVSDLKVGEQKIIDLLRANALIVGSCNDKVLMEILYFLRQSEDHKNAILSHVRSIGKLLSQTDSPESVEQPSDLESRKITPIRPNSLESGHHSQMTGSDKTDPINEEDTSHKLRDKKYVITISGKQIDYTIKNKRIWSVLCNRGTIRDMKVQATLDGKVFFSHSFSVQDLCYVKDAASSKKPDEIVETKDNSDFTTDLVPLKPGADDTGTPFSLYFKETSTETILCFDMS